MTTRGKDKRVVMRGYMRPSREPAALCIDLSSVGESLCRVVIHRAEHLCTLLDVLYVKQCSKNQVLVALKCSCWLIVSRMLLLKY